MVLPTANDDREAIRDLAVRYARCVDRREPTEVAALFTADGVLAASGGERTGAAEITAALERLSRYEVTFHFLGQHGIVAAGDGGATGELYCEAHHLSTVDGVRRDQVMFIRYQDTYRRTDGVWRFARRSLDVDWTENRVLS